MKTKLILLVLIGALVVIQFFRIDKTNPPVDRQKDYLSSMEVPLEIAQILKTSCYDCHSDEAIYPWYSNVAPVSWMLKHHINEGREHVNFSTWMDYSEKKKISIHEEITEVLEEGEMPMLSYTLIHSDAKLSESSKAALISWFKSGAQ